VQIQIKLSIGFFLGLSLAGCTAIPELAKRDAAVSKPAPAQDDDSGAAPAHKVDAGTEDAGGSLEMRAAANAPCDPNGARSCAQGGLRTPLLCANGNWARQEPCAEDDRCEMAAGPDLGKCVKIDPLCLNKASGTEVCDGDVRRACNDLVLSGPHPCGDQQRCRDDDGPAKCVCAGGSIQVGDACQMATDCSIEEGGCDLLTRCSISAGKRICSPCPTGYSGDSMKGCVPELTALQVSGGGALSPKFDPSTHDYRVQLALLQQQLTVSASRADGVSLDIDGTSVAAATPWVSPVLPLGEQTIHVRLTSKFGISNMYALTLERTGAQNVYLKASRPDQSDHFGTSVAISGDTLVVGAQHEDSASGGVNGDQSNNDAGDSGAAYVFVRSAGSWTQQAYLKADVPQAHEFFGASVAISGDTIAVGIPRTSEYGDTTAHSGQVYIFVRDAGGHWTKQAKLAGSTTDDMDLFGWSVVLQQDLLVVGAPYESSGTRQSGAVYAFRRAAGAWGAPTKLKGSQGHVESVFGWSLALDADTLVVGAMDHSGLVMTTAGPGSAYVFVASGSTWTEQQRLQAPQPTEGATFGWSVAVQGNTTAIGASRADLIKITPAGEVYLFERTADQWNFSQVLAAPFPRRSDYFGASVALSSGLLVVGATGDASGARGLQADPSRSDANASGAVYLFGRQPMGWVRSAYMKTSNAEANDAFGDHVALDGDTVVVGAIGESGTGMGTTGDPASNALTESGAVYMFR
jgi:hypothetical protein